MKNLFADLELFQRSLGSEFNNLNIDFSTSTLSLIAELDELEDAINFEDTDDIIFELGDCLCYFSICLNLSGFTFSQLSKQQSNSVNLFKIFGKISTIIQKQNRPNGQIFKNTKLVEPFTELFNHFENICDEHDLLLSPVLDVNYDKLKYRQKIGYGVFNK